MMMKRIALAALILALASPAFADGLIPGPTIPSGSTTQLQYNNAGVFGGITGATTNGTALTLVAPILGAATATSINGLAITTSTGTLAVANAKTLTASNTLTLTGTDGSSVNFGAGGTVLYSGGAVTSITGTANQITVTGTTTPTLSLPSTLIAPGTFAATSGAFGGAAIGTDALGWTGTATGSGLLTITQATANAGILASTGYSLTGSNTTSMVNLAGTLNTSGSPDVFKVSVTNTATGGTTKLLNLYAGAGGVTSMFSVDVNGSVVSAGQVNDANGFAASFNSGFFSVRSNATIWTSPASATWQSGAADVDTNAAIVAQTFRTQGALTGGTSDQAGKNFTMIISPGKGTGAGGSFILQTAPAGTTGTTPNAPVTALTVDSTSLATFAGSVVVGTASAFVFTSKGNISSPADGIIKLLNNAATGFTRLELGGATASFPSIKRNGAAINFRLADDSADAPITAAGGGFSGAITNAGITADTGQTDTTVCQDTTNHQFYSGTGTLGICVGTSSARYKTGIIPMLDSLKGVLRLHLVNFRYIKGYGDNGAKRQNGLLAEDVAKVFPDCVGLDKSGKPLSLDGFCIFFHSLKAQQEQQAEIAYLRGANDNLALRLTRLERHK